MVCELEAKYKGIKEKKAGTFTTKEGKVINYKDIYKLVFDQIIDGLPKETEIKITKEIALNLAKNLNIYDNIVIKFSVVYYNADYIKISVVSVTKK